MNGLAPGPGRARLVVAATLLLALLPALARADAKESFRQGVKALDQKRWGDATLSFRAAISENPAESAERVLIYGGRLVSYLPHYHLAVALARGGDLHGAALAFAESKRQGVASATSLGRDVARLETELAAQLAALSVPAKPAGEEVARAATRARETLATAEGVEREVAALSAGASGAQVFAEGGLGDRYQRARSELASIRAGLESAVQAADLTRVGEASRSAGQLAQTLVELREEARRRQAALAASTPTATPRPTAVARLTPTPVTPPTTDGVQAAPPAGLREALAAYLAGDYGGVLRLLAAPAPADPRAAFHVHLLRAAASHGLYRLGGGRDPALLATARRDVETCRQAQPEGTPDRRYFSPAFLDFYARPLS